MSVFPVGLAYLAGALKAAGHDVAGCNPNNLHDCPSAKTMAAEVIGKHLDCRNPDVVCTGGICTDYPFLRDCSRIIRAQRPDIPVILGGGIVGYDPKFVSSACGRISPSKATGSTS